MKHGDEVGAAPAALRMKGIRKSFPGVVALDGVDLEVRKGEVHVLLGENGAGKSTLMKILSGALRSDAGEVELDGQPVEIRDPRARAGPRDPASSTRSSTSFPQLSAAENIGLGREPALGFGLVDRAAAASGRRVGGSRAGRRHRSARPVRELGVAQQQMVEVAKALSGEARVLIMDEPTSALTAREIDAALRGHRAAHRAGRGRRLHLAPHGGGRRASATA